MNRLWSKKTFIDGEPGVEWIDGEATIKDAENMSEEEGIKTIEELLKLISQWGFKGKLDHVIVCGWFLAQIVQTIWNWRPHLWISGSQGSGKTMLSILLERLGGHLARRYEGSGSSEAGIRQDIGNNASLTFIDEFEKSNHREGIVRIMRSASRGGTISKGTSNQSIIKYLIKHMFALFSIESGQQRAAENPRQIKAETEKHPSRSPTIPSHETIEQLRIKIFAYALWASLKAKELLTHIEHIPGIDPRFLESVAVPFSMIAVCSDDPVSEINRLLGEYFAEWMRTQQGTSQEDEERLLENIMTANIRLPLSDSEDEKIKYDFRTVSQLIEKSRFSGEIHTSLQTYGVKLRNEGIFLHPEKVKRLLLQGTDWAELSIREILMRINGATSIRDRIAGSQIRGVLIPNESLAEYLEEECPTVTG